MVYIIKIGQIPNKKNHNIKQNIVLMPLYVLAFFKIPKYSALRLSNLVSSIFL